MADEVIILHGYSDDRHSFKPLADFLKSKGFKTRPLFLGDYISLEDQIAIPDLAKAFQAALEDKGVGTGRGNIDLIVHSTGALVAREWLTRFYLEAGKDCPLDHFLMLAPANFGSPLGHVGKTMLGRIVKGWRTGFESGTQVLNALELASPYSRGLAQRDLFGRSSYYRPDTCMCAVLVGSKPYQTGLRKLVDKNGGDGTVYVCTANLNATGMTVRFGPKGTETVLEQWRRAAKPIAFGVFPDRDHASITRPGDDPLGERIVEFLKLDSPAAYADFSVKCQRLTETTLPDTPQAEIYHSYQNLAAHVSDDLGSSVADYFLEFYQRPKSKKDEFRIDNLMVKIHSEILESVHAYENDKSHRSLLFDLTDLNRELQGGKELTFSLSAAPLSKLIGYTAGADGNISELPVDLGSDHHDAFWRPNETLFLELVIGRTQAAKAFGLYKY